MSDDFPCPKCAVGRLYIGTYRLQCDICNYCIDRECNWNREAFRYLVEVVKELQQKIEKLETERCWEKIEQKGHI